FLRFRSDARRIDQPAPVRDGQSPRRHQCPFQEGAPADVFMSRTKSPHDLPPPWSCRSLSPAVGTAALLAGPSSRVISLPAHASKFQKRVSSVFPFIAVTFRAQAERKAGPGSLVRPGDRLPSPATVRACTSLSPHSR